eukprot:CAMPEP_0172606442 /NCGR_PEP_ID=MMETSP1068-20121228/26642_1 /TAXON_ID=35684 /ORGANISM="Pseudopedinella elastica, Strain CCMP716" /LENGTH=125 /DNA_ID=CAMNT_0013409137 /DNA_START=167 /DNA_END=546 /DNA_ORIENTATION=-
MKDMEKSLEEEKSLENREVTEKSLEDQEVEEEVCGEQENFVFHSGFGWIAESVLPGGSGLQQSGRQQAAWRQAAQQHREEADWQPWCELVNPPTWSPLSSRSLILYREQPGRQEGAHGWVAPSKM